MPSTASARPPRNGPISRKHMRCLTVADSEFAIDYDLFESLRVMCRIGVCGCAVHLGKIEDDKIGEVAFTNQATILQSHDFRGQARCGANRKRQRDYVL